MAQIPRPRSPEPPHHVADASVAALPAPSVPSPLARAGPQGGGKWRASSRLFRAGGLRFQGDFEVPWYPELYY